MFIHIRQALLDKHLSRFPQANSGRFWQNIFSEIRVKTWSKLLQKS